MAGEATLADSAMMEATSHETADDVRRAACDMKLSRRGAFKRWIESGQAGEPLRTRPMLGKDGRESESCSSSTARQSRCAQRPRLDASAATAPAAASSPACSSTDPEPTRLSFVVSMNKEAR